MFNRQKIAAALIGTAIAAATVGVALAAPATAAAPAVHDNGTIGSATAPSYPQAGQTPYGGYQNRHKRG